MKNLYSVISLLLLFVQNCSAQFFTKEWWKGSEAYIGVDFNYSGSIDMSDLGVEPLQYLGKNEDELGLLENELLLKPPYEFYGNDYADDQSWDIPKPMSYTISLALLRPLKNSVGEPWFYFGPTLRFNNNQFSETYRTTDYSSNFYMYSQGIYFTEPGLYDSLVYSQDHRYDTMVLPRFKMVQLKNPSTNLHLGLRCKWYLIKGDKRRVSIDVGVAKTVGLSNKVTVYSNYFDFGYAGSYLQNITINEEYIDNYITLLNDESRYNQTSQYKAPRTHGSSFNVSLSYDRIIKKMNDLTIGFSAKYIQQKVKRKVLLSKSMGFSFGIYVSKPIGQ